MDLDSIRGTTDGLLPFSFNTARDWPSVLFAGYAATAHSQQIGTEVHKVGHFRSTKWTKWLVFIDFFKLNFNDERITHAWNISMLPLSFCAKSLSFLILVSRGTYAPW